MRDELRQVSQPPDLSLLQGLHLPESSITPQQFESPSPLGPSGLLRIRPRRHLPLDHRLLIPTTGRHITFPLQLQSQWHLDQRDLLHRSKPPNLSLVHPAAHGQMSNVRAPYTLLRINLSNPRLRHIHRRPTQLRISTLSQLSPNTLNRRRALHKWLL